MLFRSKNAVIINNPKDMGEWPETARITNVSFGSGRVVVDFDRRASGDRWPESSFGDGGPGTVQYTLGLCAKLGDGKYYCSAVIQFWFGRDLDQGGGVNLISADWYYDVRWGALMGYQPKAGERVGIFVGQGNLRDNTAGFNTYKERSNVQFVNWGTDFVLR